MNVMIKLLVLTYDYVYYARRYFHDWEKILLWEVIISKKKKKKNTKKLTIKTNS